MSLEKTPKKTEDDLIKDFVEEDFSGDISELEEQSEQQTREHESPTVIQLRKQKEEEAKKAQAEYQKEFEKSNLPSENSKENSPE
ncbi:MAG: hypothetical protein AAB636_02470 [Patescibacteria group bacterium]